MQTPENTENQAIRIILDRRMTREFQNSPVKKEDINIILHCAQRAPSGINHQPWQIHVITDVTLKNRIASCTHYRKTIESAPVVLVIYNIPSDYSPIKNFQSIGAFFENILLACHALGIGAVWNGEILNQESKVKTILPPISPANELMGIIALGYPKDLHQFNSSPDTPRKEISEFVYRHE